jgi:hypothetical protein
MTRTPNGSFSLVACLLPLIGLPAVAQDDDESAFDRTPQDCILASSIDEHDAIDDQNILFYMRDGKVYRNHLPRKCPGLERENRISYQLRGTRRLCSIDTITVLEDSVFGGGVGFRDGFTCRLGEFVPLSPEEIEDLELLAQEARRSGRRGGRQAQSTVETSQVELPPAETDGDEAATDEAPVVDGADDSEN